MNTFFELMKRGFNRLTGCLLATVLCGALVLPGKTYAGVWDDSPGGNIEEIIANVKSMLDTINNAKSTVTDGNVKAMFGDMRVVLKDAVDAQQDGVSEFISQSL
jgi:hypothetical protein